MGFRGGEGNFFEEFQDGIRSFPTLVLDDEILASGDEGDES